MVVADRFRKHTKAEPKKKRITKAGNEDLRVFDDEWQWCSDDKMENPPIALKVRITKKKGKVNWAYVSGD